MKVNFFYVFTRKFVQDGDNPPVGQIMFHKINGRNWGDGFIPMYSAANTPQPYWWVDQSIAGKTNIFSVASDYIC